MIRRASLVPATIGIGLMAGLFFTYAVAVMPGLGDTGDRTFVDAFQSIDRAITGGWTDVVILGGFAATVLAAALHLGKDNRSVLPWIAAALALYVATFVITAIVNVPLNNDIKDAGDPGSIDLAAVREEFSEDRWVRWNVVRTVTNTAALGCIAWALVLSGRQSRASREW